MIFPDFLASSGPVQNRTTSTRIFNNHVEAQQAFYASCVFSDVIARN